MNKKEIKINPAFLIIDVQNCFVSSRGSFGKLGYNVLEYQKIIPIIKNIYGKIKLLKIPIFFSQAVRERNGIDILSKEHQILPKKRRERIERLPICIRGTWDGNNVSELIPDDDDFIVIKRRDSIFQDTEFEMWARSLKIDTLIFTGVDTAICVESSIRDAFNRGFDVILVSDATASMNKEFYESTIKEVEENYGLVMNSSDLFKRIKQADDKYFSLSL